MSCTPCLPDQFRQESEQLQQYRVAAADPSWQAYVNQENKALCGEMRYIEVALIDPQDIYQDCNKLSRFDVYFGSYVTLISLEETCHFSEVRRNEFLFAVREGADGLQQLVVGKLGGMDMDRIVLRHFSCSGILYMTWNTFHPSHLHMRLNIDRNDGTTEKCVLGDVIHTLEAGSYPADVSYAYYGVHDYWQCILTRNNISSTAVYRLPVGEKLIIPPNWACEYYLIHDKWPPEYAAGTNS